MQDLAPDLSMDYSFLLESPVLDREESLASPHGGDLHRFALSKLSHQVRVVCVCVFKNQCQQLRRGTLGGALF